jgi:hypothetical protein
VSGAQRHDVKLLEPTLDNIVIERPSGKGASRQHLCGDKAYVGQPAQESIRQRNLHPAHSTTGGGDGVQEKKSSLSCSPMGG